MSGGFCYLPWYGYGGIWSALGRAEPVEASPQPQQLL